MSFLVDCPSCLEGNHDGHDPAWGIKPDLIGGMSCACPGDCMERTRVRQAEFAKWFNDHVLEEDSPEDRKVSTHDYSGFGGKTACEYINWSTGERCGRPPEEHGYKGRHRREAK